MITEQAVPVSSATPTQYLRTFEQATSKGLVQSEAMTQVDPDDVSIVQRLVKATPAPGANLGGSVVYLTPEQIAQIAPAAFAGLTNDQLRAAAVPVVVAALPLPAGAATDAGLQSVYGQLATGTSRVQDAAAGSLLTSILAGQTSGTQKAIVSNPADLQDSAEREYLPGLQGSIVSAVGDTVVYTAPAGKAFRIHWTYAVPVLRGSEDPPVITVKVQNASGATVATPYVLAGVTKRKVITGPVGGKVAIGLDIAARVPVTLDVEEFTP